MSQTKPKTGKLTTLLLPEHLAKTKKDSNKQQQQQQQQKQQKQQQQQQQQPIVKTSPVPVVEEASSSNVLVQEDVNLDTLCGIVTVLQREMNLKKPKFIPHLQNRPPQWRISTRLPFLLQEVIYATVTHFVNDWMEYAKTTTIERIPLHLALTIHQEILWKPFVKELINQDTLTAWEEPMKWNRVEVVKEGKDETEKVNENVLAQFEPDVIPTTFVDKANYFYNVLHSMSKGMVTKSYSKLFEKSKPKKRKSTGKGKDEQNKKKRTEEAKKSDEEKEEEEEEKGEDNDENEQKMEEDDDDNEKEKTKKTKNKKQNKKSEKSENKETPKTKTNREKETSKNVKQQKKRSHDSDDDDDADYNDTKSKKTSNRSQKPTAKKQTAQSGQKRK